jgi:hypothetical protein
MGWQRGSKHRFRLYPDLPLTIMRPHDSLVELPVSQVFGLTGLLWTIRYWRWRSISRRWQSVAATVQAQSFLRFATNAGWLSVSYTYTFADEVFTGELRKWIISKKTSKAESDPDTIDYSKRFPLGSRINVLVDPDRPRRSLGAAD